MTITASEPPNIASLLEQGHHLLEEQQFKSAKAYFDLVLKKDSQNAQAHWGLMLVTRQCKNTRELYTRLAVPIGKNSDYIRAIENASAEQKIFFQKIEQMVLLACHKRVLQNFLEGKVFFTSKWIEHYDKAEVNQKLFDAEHTYISECLRTKQKANIQKLLLSVYEKCKALPDLGDKAYVNSVMQFVQQEYSACMNSLLADIQKNINCVPTDLLSAWADPLGTGTDNFKISTTVDLGLDGHPATAADRYIALAALLSEKHFTVQAYKGIDFCYEMALRLKHTAEYISHRGNFYEKTVMRAGITTEEIEYIILRAPNISQYRWQYVLVATNNLTKKLPSYEKDQKVTAFLQKNKDSYDQNECNALILMQESLLKKATEEYNYFLTPLHAHVEKAKAYAEAAEKQKIASMWDQYLKKTEADHSRNIAAIEDRLSQIKKKNQEDNKAGKQVAFAKGLMQLLVSVLLLALSIPVYFSIAHTSASAKELLNYPVLAVYLIVLGCIAVVSALQIGITKRFCDAAQKKFKIPSFFRGAVKAANVIAKVLMVASVAFLVYCAIMFPKNAGTIPIKCAEDLKYIKNAPACTFCLETDIDLTDAPAFHLGNFRGVLDGNGHSIGNMSLDGEYLIRTNSGMIKNLTLHNITAENALINKNTGTLNNISLSAIDISVNKSKAPKNTALFVNINAKNGNISACSVSNSNFSFAFTQKLSGSSCCIGGLVSTNDGSLSGCSISATIQGELALASNNEYLYFGGLAAKSLELYGCSAAGEITLKLRDKMKDGEISDPDFYLQAGGLLGEGKVYQSSFDGNLNINYSVDTTGRRTMDMDHQYNVGGLVGTGMAKNSYSTGNMTVSIDNTNNDVVTRIKYIGTLIGNANNTPWVENCYTTMACALSLDDSSYDGASMVGGSYRSHQDAIQNSFVYPKKSVTDQKATTTHKNGANGITTKNCYCAAGYNYDTHWSLDECTDIDAYNLKNADFILNTLGWDSTIWDIQDGSLPKLKPYTNNSPA